MTNSWLVERERNNLAIAAQHSPWLDAGAVNKTYGVIKALTGLAMTDAERQTAISMLNWAARS